MPGRLIQVSRADDPRVAPFADIKERQLRDLGPDSALFIAEGELVVRRLVESRFRVQSLLLADNRVEQLRDCIDRLADGTPVFVLSRAHTDALVGFPMHRGVLALGERGPRRTVADLLSEHPPALVLLENLTNHDNIGGMFRNVAALAPRGTAVVLSPRCADPLYRKSVRVSIGSVLRAPFACSDDWERDLASVRRAGLTLIALTPAAEALDIRELAVRHKPGRLRPALLLGSEGPGLDSRTMALAEHRVRIPVHAEADSVNVAVAGAVALYALTRPDEPASGSSV